MESPYRFSRSIGADDQRQGLVEFYHIAVLRAETAYALYEELVDGRHAHCPEGRAK